MNECFAYTFGDSAARCRLNLLSSLQSKIAFNQILDLQQTLAISSFDRVLELIGLEKQNSNNQRMHQSVGGHGWW
ncbi:hypothetical protein Poly24_45860 [Rosistilla carotiformis]|uniref:Uncharacterized protein n=1 Tax=Rosistilla carotiformis TaxID=2528017 RepID=A0A518JZ84_9BACT|nr:hypothetical protein [Rosistilla carotiformis]QDV70853.1 hypothetical protein Poly24_45860 [Rosistilla carotiformis]